MRDQRFVREHRGGTLTEEHHRLLMDWACACAEHVLPRIDGDIDPRVTHALEVAHEWRNGRASVGQARNAAYAVHAAAREATSPVATAVARAAGHAVATAHMADHALGPARYALEAVKATHGSVEMEREWQDANIPPEIRDLVLSGRAAKDI